MSIYYLDYEGGNDANDGTTYANRWKTFITGATAARIAPGDEVRVKESPPQTSLAITATWTDKSPTVTLASALNALVTDCDSAFTASANVTATTTTTRRTGSNAASLAIAAGFTTGKAAYFGLGGAQNYSGYQGITLWVRVNAALVASTLSIRLCSDTTGDVTVDTLPLPAISQANQWIGVYIDKGSALGASIQSIALYADLDPGTITVLLDNISTTKAAGSDCLNLQTLIGKNTGTETWWGLREINGTTLQIDTDPTMTAGSAARGYSGTTESVTTYIRKTTRTDLVATSTTGVHSVQDSGTVGNMILFSGGWNSSDMTAQSGETWFDGQSGFGYGINVNLKNYVHFDKLNAVRYNRGLSNDGNYTKIGSMAASNCVIGAYLGNSVVITDLTTRSLEVTGTILAVACGGNGIGGINLARATINKLEAYGCGYGSVTSGINLSMVGDVHITTIVSKHHFFHSFTTSGSWVFGSVGSLTALDPGQSGCVIGDAIDLTIDYCECAPAGGSNVAFDLRASWKSVYIKELVTVSTGGQALWNLNGAGFGSTLKIGKWTSSGTGVGLRHSGTGIELIVNETNLSDTLPIVLDGGGFAKGISRLGRYGGAADDHRGYYGSGSHRVEVFSEASVRHTASGIAWKISPKSDTYWSQASPFILPLGKFAVNASALVTVRLWARRTNTGIAGTLRVLGGQLPGMSSDVNDSITAVADTWEELEVTFTPTAKGTVELEFVCWGGTAHSVYIDDMTLLQA